MARAAELWTWLGGAPLHHRFIEAVKLQPGLSESIRVSACVVDSLVTHVAVWSASGGTISGQAVRGQEGVPSHLPPPPVANRYPQSPYPPGWGGVGGSEPPKFVYLKSISSCQPLQ